MLEYHRKLSILNSKLSILNSQLSTLNSQLSTLNSKLSTFNFQLSTLNYKSRLAFALYVLFEEHVLAVEHCVGELRNPIAQYHHARLAREDEVEFDVAVAIHEVVDVGMGLHVLLGVQYEVLALLAHIGRFHAIDTLEA